MPIKTVIEYMEDAERELIEAVSSTGRSTESGYHAERAPIYATSRGC